MKDPAVSDSRAKEQRRELATRRTLCSAVPSWAGEGTMMTPAFSSAATLSSALPLPPEMTAPAWPTARGGITDERKQGGTGEGMGEVGRTATAWGGGAAAEGRARAVQQLDQERDQRQGEEKLTR